MRNRQPFAVIVLAFAAAVLTVTGCAAANGDNGNPVVDGARLETLRGASAALRNAGGARFAVRTTTDGVTAPASGALSTDPAASETEMRVRAGSESVTMTERIVDGTAYLRSSVFADVGLRGWLKADLSGASGGASTADFAGGLAVSDPAQPAELLSGIEQVRLVGTAVVRGTRTTHYRGVVNPRAALRRSTGNPEMSADAARTFEQQIEQLLSLPAIPVDVWLDGAHRPRRIALSLSKGGTSTRLDIQYFAFGAPTAIEVPPADQVQDFAEYGRRAGVTNG